MVRQQKGHNIFWKFKKSELGDIMTEDTQSFSFFSSENLFQLNFLFVLNVHSFVVWSHFHDEKVITEGFDFVLVRTDSVLISFKRIPLCLRI